MGTLFTRKAVTGFVKGKSLVLPMYLASLCQTIECSAGQTCTELGCVSEQVDENSLNEVKGDDLDISPNTPRPDAGIPNDRPDASAPPAAKPQFVAPATGGGQLSSPNYQGRFVITAPNPAGAFESPNYKATITVTGDQP